MIRVVRHVLRWLNYRTAPTTRDKVKIVVPQGRKRLP